MLKRKTINLSIHEQLPFRVKYHEEEGESVCTVKQDDLEGLFRAYRLASKFGTILGIAAVLFAICLGYAMVKYQDNPIVYTVEKK